MWTISCNEFATQLKREMIETSRLRLRRLRESDHINMMELESNPQIMRFTPMAVPQTPEQSRQRLESSLRKDYGLMGIWVAENKDTEDFIGWFMLIPTCYHFPELGFMIVQRHWGKGYATEACEALLQYGFRKLGLEGIVAVTSQDNEASKKVLKKLDFTRLKDIQEKKHSLHLFELKQPQQNPH